MTTFTVILTRDCTESVIINVNAEDELDAAEEALSHVPETGWAIDSDNIPQPPYVSDVQEAWLPEWATSQILDGSYLHVRASLPTKDGRVCGNAVIVEIETSKHDDTPLATVVTDAGNVLKLNENELRGMFHPPQYIMRSLLLTHLRAWFAEGENQG